MRIPVLAFSGLFLLSSCSGVLEQQIVRAQIKAPAAPPSPILPLDDAQRVVAQGGLSQRVGSYPKGQLLTDSSTSQLGLSFDPLVAGGLFVLHYQLFWSALELSGTQNSILLGANAAQEDWKILAYFGFGLTSFHQQLLLEQQVLVWDGSKDTLVTSNGSFSRFNSTVGISIMSSQGRVQPFLAGRLLSGPMVDGSERNEVAATNAFTLGQFVLDAGLRVEVSPELHLLGGVGWRSFTSGTIRGSDGRAFLGVTVDLARVETHTHSTDPVRIKSDSYDP